MRGAAVLVALMSYFSQSGKTGGLSSKCSRVQVEKMRRREEQAAEGGVARRGISHSY